VRFVAARSNALRLFARGKPVSTPFNAALRVPILLLARRAQRIRFKPFLNRGPLAT
jgi:hypothetical protein